MQENNTTNLTPIGTYGMSCAGCGSDLAPADKVACCPDCGAVFCQDCVDDGTFESHICEDDDYEDIYEEDDYGDIYEEDDDE